MLVLLLLADSDAMFSVYCVVLCCVGVRGSGFGRSVVFILVTHIGILNR